MLDKMERGRVLLKTLQEIAAISLQRIHTDDDMAAIFAKVGDAITVHLMADEPNKESENVSMMERLKARDVEIERLRGAMIQAVGTLDQRAVDICRQALISNKESENAGYRPSGAPSGG